MTSDAAAGRVAATAWTRRMGATCVAAATRTGVDARAALLTGPPGAGKSTLALKLVALGGVLVADDGVPLRRVGDRLSAAACDRAPGLIEARGLGLLALDPLAEARVVLVVSLRPRAPQRPVDHAARLPRIGRVDILGTSLPFIETTADESVAAGLICCLRGGRLLDPDA